MPPAGIQPLITTRRAPCANTCSENIGCEACLRHPNNVKSNQNVRHMGHLRWQVPVSLGFFGVCSVLVY